MDSRTFFNYYRLTADGRILWGTSEAAYYPGNRVDVSCDHSAKHYADLRASFRRHFPRLADLEFPFAWGGPIASTTRLTPFFGTLAGRLSYGLGYTGHGIGSTRMAGKILAHLALDRKSPLLELVDGAEEAVSVSARAAAAACGLGGHAFVAEGGRGRETGRDAEGSGRDRDQLLVVVSPLTLILSPLGGRGNCLRAPSPRGRGSG